MERSRGGPDLARHNNNKKKKNGYNKKKQSNAKDGPLINLYNYLLVGELGGEQFRLNSSVDATTNFFRYRRNETKQNNNNNTPEKKRVASVLTTTSSRKDHKSSSTGKKRNTDLHNAKKEDQPKGDVEQSSHNTAGGEASLDNDSHCPVVSPSPKSFNFMMLINFSFWILWSYLFGLHRLNWHWNFWSLGQQNRFLSSRHHRARFLHQYLPHLVSSNSSCPVIVHLLHTPKK